MAEENNKELEQTVDTAEQKAPEANEATAEATAPAAEASKAKSKKPARVTRGKRGKKRVVRSVSTGRCYIQATYNNTIVTLTDSNGNVLSWSSAGVCGFRGPKKSTPYAAGVIVKDACDKSRETGLREVAVFVRGIGSGREAAVRALHANGINVMAIKDVTPIPHNGCRAPKPRRM
jgi:small subunit ribosomal protein S11